MSNDNSNEIVPAPLESPLTKEELKSLEGPGYQLTVYEEDSDANYCSSHKKHHKFWLCPIADPSVEEINAITDPAERFLMMLQLNSQPRFGCDDIEKVKALIEKYFLSGAMDSGPGINIAPLLLG